MLRRAGGIADTTLKSVHEAWRIRYAGSVFTAYLSGSLVCNGGDAPELEFIYGKITQIAGQTLSPASKPLLIGLDETGKGEVLGHAALAAVKVSADSILALDRIVGSVDTKSRKDFGFWDKLNLELEQLRGRGVEYLVETIPPWDIDRYNVNKILDVVYQRILGRVLIREDPVRVRIIIDDYGIGANLERYLESLAAAGAEVRVEAKADEHYPEVRTASIVAKWKRELAMKGLRERYSSKDFPIGSGNAGDPETIAWLKQWKEQGHPWPWFVKTSFRTIRELDGLAGTANKLEPPIRHDLLSVESARSFNEGRLSTATLAIVCPSCGHAAAAAKLTPPTTGGGLLGRCVACNEPISNLDTTLRYYSGVVLADSSVIVAGSISADLERKGFFEGFTLLLPTVVSRETDQPGGRRELGRLADYAAMGRIWMGAVTTEVPDDPALRDSTVIQAAKAHDAILVTRDAGMYGNAVAQRVFCLTFKTAG